MENSNRNHRVLAGVLTAAMVLSSFSMATTGAFAAPTPEQNGIAASVRTAAAPTAVATTTTLAVANKDATKTDYTYGDTVTLTATVAKVGTAVPAGTVTFKDGDTELKKDVAVDSTTGKATFDATTLNAGEHNITATFVPTDEAAYKTSTSTKAATVTVAKKALTATVKANQHVNYNGTNTFAGVPVVVTGMVNGETEPAATATVTVADAAKNASTTAVDIASASAPVFTAANANYTLSAKVVYTTGEDKTAAPIKVFVDKAAAPTFAPASEFVNASTLNTIDLATLFAGPEAAKTYTVKTVTDTDNILTGADTGKAAVNAAGELTYTGATDVGTKTATVVVTIEYNNYASVDVTLNIAGTTDEIVDTDAFTVAKNTTYSGKAVKATGAPTAGAADVKYYKATDLQTSIDAPTDAGDYVAVYTAPAGKAGTKTVKFTIAQAELTATAASATITVGGTVKAAYDVTYTGFVNGETKDDVITTVATATTTADGKTAGTFDIVPSTTTLNTDGKGKNYTVKNVNGVLTVNAVQPVTPGSGSSTTVSSSTDTTPVAATVTAASTNPTVKAVLDKILDTKADASIVATFKKSDKKISITATALAGKDVYMYKLVNGKLEVVSSKSFAVDKSGVLTLDNPEAASTTKKATAAADDSVTYVLIPASEKPPVASVSGTVQVAQGNTVLFNVTSGKSTDASFAAGNGAVSETRLYKAYKDGTASYGAYGHGKPGDVTGMYVNGVKLFEVEVVAAPYKSDTTVNITNKKHGDMYWFKITPNNKSAKVAYTAGNGAVLSTRSKGLQKDGSYLFGFQITGKTGDKSGVYVEIDGQQYCVFNVAVK